MRDVNGKKQCFSPRFLTRFYPVSARLGGILELFGAAT
jgi:hypothetical protein